MDPASFPVWTSGNSASVATAALTDPRRPASHGTNPIDIIVGELANWRGHSPEQIEAMKTGLGAPKPAGAAIIDD